MHDVISHTEVRFNCTCPKLRASVAPCENPTHDPDGKLAPRYISHGGTETRRYGKNIERENLTQRRQVAKKWNKKFVSIHGQSFCNLNTSALICG